MVSEEIAHEGLTWINISVPTYEEIRPLEDRFGFHKLDLEDCLSKMQTSKIDQYDNYLFVVFHFPVQVRDGGVIRASQVSAFLGKDFLVTVHEGDMGPLGRIFRSFKDDAVQRQSLMGRSPSFLLYTIIDALVDDLFPVVNKIMQNLEVIEDEVYDEKTDTILNLTQLRREIAALRRVLGLHRRMITELMSRAQRFSPEDMAPYFDDVRDHTEKIWDMLENCNETINIYKDTDLILNTQRTNRVLSILTIVFTLSIPGTLLGTYYGMNIHLPGGIESGPWTFLGPYTTLLFILVLSAVPAALLTAYFRRLGWI